MPTSWDLEYKGRITTNEVIEINKCLLIITKAWYNSKNNTTKICYRFLREGV